MRNEFAQALVELAAEDSNVVLLTGDLGFMVLEPFSERFPDRFVNVGVAEQNMVGLATGLADAGYTPFVYSIATFASMRPYEFIRNGPLLHDLPVRIIGVGGGFDYGHNGITHYALEDIGMLKIQPNLTVIAPADAAQARAALFVTAELSNPIYFRIGREGSPVPGLGGRFQLGRAALIGEGSDVAVVTLGTMTHRGVQAAEILAGEGIYSTVVVVPSFNPAPVDDLAEVFARVSLVVTAEAHYVAGGVGSLAAEVIAERGLDCRLVRCGVREMPRGVTGTQDFLCELYGLSPDAIAGAALRALTVTQH